MSDPSRRTGATSRQMQEAPQNATFIWVDYDLHYPRLLARHLGRTDLVIVSPNWLEHGPIGRRGLCIVIDHAAVLTPRQCDAVGRHAAMGVWQQ